MELHWSKPLIFTEGNIGSGKSTVARRLAEKLKLRLLPEPVDEELLDLFYKDQKRWSFPFQMEMLHRRWAMQMSAAAETIIHSEYNGSVLDRSLWGDLVFASTLTEAGVMHKKEWDIYISAVRNMSFVLFPPTVLLYLSASPETCMERIRRRGRPQESDITIDYLRTIHNGYQKLLKECRTGFFPWSHAVTPLVLTWDPDTKTDREWDEVCKTIEEACKR